MATSIKNLKSKIDDRLTDTQLTALECYQLVRASDILDDTLVSVDSITSLPDAVSNKGRLVYINDINEYRYSNGEFWSDNLTSIVEIYSQNLWVWGGSCNNPVGDGTLEPRCSPVREFYSANNWCMTSTGYHTSALKTDGTIWSWGRALVGNIGDGENVTRAFPVQEFYSDTNWCSVSVGNANSSALKIDGTLWSWGCNCCGMLGIGTIANISSAVQEVCSATDWCLVSAGCNHAAAIKTSGDLWSWGNNLLGRLGDGTVISSCSPVREVSLSTDWCHVSVNQHTSAIKTSGELWSWGVGNCGALGDGTTISRCSPVREICSATDWCTLSVGFCNTAAVKIDGTLWVWGTNTCGKLGDNTITARCSPVREITSSTNWCLVSAGYNHTAAVKTNGELWAWGSNFCGRLGDGTSITRVSPVREFNASNDWCLVSSGRNNTSGIQQYTKGFCE